MKEPKLFMVAEHNTTTNEHKLKKILYSKQDAIATAKWLNEDLKDISITYMVEEWRKHE